MRSIAIFVTVAFASAFLLSGCSSSALPERNKVLSEQTEPTSASFSQSAVRADDAGTGYTMPPFRDAAFHADAANGENGAKIDLSCTAQGYVAVMAVSDTRLKFQVISGETTYTYDLDKDGVPGVFPLNCGNGTYQFRVMRNVGDSQYVVQYSTSAEVVLKSELEPFLRPSQMVNYSADSDCVKKAEELVRGCETDTEVVAAVYGYLTENVVYDYDKAENVKKGYLPDPDSTLSTGTGICFDYAALAAAMLRSAGIPTRLMTGYVGETYHAWNMVYLKNRGWITVGIEASPNIWQRFDTTFAANGVETAFLTDNANYVDRYTY